MLKKAKNTSEKMITDTTVNGKPIILRKKNGRPFAMTHKSPDWYPLDTRMRAALQYTVTGSFEKTSELTGIPVGTLRTFSKTEWWDEVQKMVHNEENAAISAKLTMVAGEALDQLLDRVTNGEKVLDKEGNEKRVPMRAMDIARPLSNLIKDRQLLRGQATTRSEKIDTDDRLKDLASNFKKFSKNSTIVDVTPTVISSEMTPEEPTIDSEPLIATQQCPTTEEEL